MPRLGYMIVDGLAFVMVGVGLTAVVAGYERNLPVPPEQLVAVTETASTWADPETTGAITPKDKGAAAKGTPHRGAGGQSVIEASTGGRGTWIDPPRR